MTIGSWKSVAELAAFVTRSIRRYVRESGPFTGGPPQRFDIFSYETLTAGRRRLNVEPDTVPLFGPVNLLLTRRRGELPVRDLRTYRSRFEPGDFDFEQLRRLIAAANR